MGAMFKAMWARGCPLMVKGEKTEIDVAGRGGRHRDTDQANFKTPRFWSLFCLK